MSFATEQEAAKVAYITRNIKGELYELALDAFFKLATSDNLDAIGQKAAELFPGIATNVHDSEGNYYYSVGDVANALNMDPDEIAAIHEEDDTHPGMALQTISTRTQ